MCSSSRLDHSLSLATLACEFFSYSWLNGVTAQNQITDLRLRSRGQVILWSSINEDMTPTFDLVGVWTISPFNLGGREPNHVANQNKDWKKDLKGLESTLAVNSSSGPLHIHLLFSSLPYINLSLAFSLLAIVYFTLRSSSQVLSEYEFQRGARLARWTHSYRTIQQWCI